VDQRFIYLSLASPEAERYSIETGTVALVNGEKLHLRSEAVRLMLWHAGGVALILSLFLWMIPLPIRDWAYRLIAKHRYRFFGGVCDLSGL
jgi:predicted DCC family thiol-disulfide oxidoreductase YuxK